MEKIKPEDAQSTLYSIQTVKSPTSIDNLPKNTTLTTFSDISTIGQAGGLVKLDIKPEPEGGYRPGKHASVELSTGQSLQIAVKVDEHGIAVVPPLRGRDWRLIDDEINGEKYDNGQIAIIRPEDENYWSVMLAQGRAALLPCPFDHILTRITRLKLQKPTQNMDAPATAVFLEDIAEHLERREYCYHAIDEGIHRLIELEDDKFFPTMKTLLKYIHPIHWQLKRRINTLERALQRGHKAIEERKE